jgi:hypothetical protein
MSSDTYNIIVPVPNDPNSYHINDLNIEFLKGYKKEYNEIFTNKNYRYAPLLNTHNVYPVVEFSYKDPNGYIKKKDSDLWLHEIDGNLLFDHLKPGLFTTRQPLVLWFQYTREREFIVYKLLGYNVEALVKKTYDHQQNIAYLNYRQDGDKIFMRWTRNVNAASKWRYDKIKWNEIGWIKLQSKQKQRELLDGNKQYLK